MYKKKTTKLRPPKANKKRTSWKTFGRLIFKSIKQILSILLLIEKILKWLE